MEDMGNLRGKDIADMADVYTCQSYVAARFVAATRICVEGMNPVVLLTRRHVMGFLTIRARE